MITALDAILEQYRDASLSEREKGTYFENLTISFLSTDPRWTAQLSNVQTYAKWARSNGYPENDTGIDLVAEQVDQAGYCAIQCKFYAEGHRIQKADIDSPVVHLGNNDFQIVDIISTAFVNPLNNG